MSFTPEEVREAVDAFLGSPVEVPSLTTGARDILLARDRAFALLTNALVGDPQAVYHLAWMASNRLYGLIKSQREALVRIDKAASQVQQVRFRTLGRFDDLSTAQTALLELDTAVSGSGAGASGPGVGQFQRSVRQFASRELRPLLPEVEYGGTDDIADTPLNLRRVVQRSWADAKGLDQKIKDISFNIEEMLTELSRLRLPERSIQSVITSLRVRTAEVQEELSSSEAEASARQAYLDLLVMDSILGRTAQFSVPALVLSVGSGATQAAPIAGGIAASTLSGPYLIDAGDTLEIDVGGVIEYVVLPESSARQVRTGEIGDVDETTTYTLSTRAQNVASAISEQSSSVASVRLSTQGMTLHNVNLVSADEASDKLYLALFSVEGAVTNQPAATVTVPSWVTDADFNAADRVVIETDSALGPHVITGRDLGARTYTLSPGPQSSSSDASYVTLQYGQPGPAIGDKIELISPFNPTLATVHYEVVGYVDGVVTLDQDLVKGFVDGPTPGTGSVQSVFAANIATVFTEYLDVQAPAGSSLDIPDNAISQKLGLDPANLAAPPDMGKVEEINVPEDLLFQGVEVGDIIELDSVEYGITNIVTAPLGALITIDTAIPYTAATYAFRVLSARHRAHAQMVEAVGTYPDDIPERLDILVNQTLQGKAAGQLSVNISTLLSEIDPVMTALQAFTSPARSQVLDAAVAMMRELGMDRAVDMLLSLQLEELFTMSKDGVSYNTNLVRAAATATRVVSPVSKDQKLDEEILGVFSSDIGISD